MFKRSFVGKMAAVLFLALVSSAAVFAAEVLPKIKKTAKAPFNKRGRIVAPVWKNADILGRFTIPARAVVAVNQTQVQLLYDKTNLYISIMGRRFPQWDRSREIPKPGLWKGNNFEIFFKEEGSPAGHYHVVIARKENPFFTKGSISDPVNAKKIKVSWHDASKHVFYANVTIPLSILELQGKELAGKKVRFNVARQDADTPEKKIVHSSYAALTALSYHKVDTWPVIEFADDAASSAKRRFCWHDTKAFRINLIPNGDFAAAINGRAALWNYGKDTQRQEIMLYSNSYMLSATHNAYVMAVGGSLAANWVVPGKEYTFVVRMRRQGNDGAFGLIQLARRPDGKVRGKTYVAWGTPVSNEWHDYSFSTKIDEGLVQFAFYRRAKDRDSKLDIASIALYEGKVATFEIRKATSSSGTLPAGKPIATPKNIFGKTPVKKKYLYIGNYTSGITNCAREFTEIVNGLNVDYDIINASAKNKDIYYTTSDPDKIASAIEKNLYDLYVIGRSPYSGSIYERIGKELAKKITANVEKGASLVMMQERRYGSFTPFVKKYPAKKLTNKNHFLKKSLPAGMFTLSKYNKEPLKDIRERSAGKGYVLYLSTASSRMALQLLNDDDENLHSVFPFENYTNAFYARLFHYAANKGKVPHAVITSNGKEAFFSYEKLPANAASVKWKVTNKDGSFAAAGKAKIAAGKAKAAFDAGRILSGNYMVEAHLLDAADKVLAYDNAVFTKKGPAIADLKKKEEMLSKKGKASISLQVKGVDSGMRIDWAWEDFSGRVLEKGSVKASSRVRFSVPLKHAFTTLTKLDVRLIHKGRTLDRARMALIIPDCDRERLLKDFHLQAWGYGAHEPTSRFTSAQLEKQAEEIGIRAYNYSDVFAALLSGKNVARLGVGGSAFRDSRRLKRNDRQYPFNTAKARAAIINASTKNALEMKKYGIFCGGQVDEAEYTSPSSFLEPDTNAENVAEYRKRMKKLFNGDIALFNKRSGSSYRSFEELKPCFVLDVRKNGNWGEYVLWREFNADRWIEGHRLSYDTLKKVDPTAHYQLQNTYGQGVCSGNDYWKIHNLTGYNVSTDYGIYNSAGRTGAQRHTDEFLRSFNENIIHRPYNGFSQDTRFAHYKPWRAAFHRFAGYTHYCFYRSIWRLVHVAPYYNITRYAKLCSKILRESMLYDGLGKLCLEYKWDKRDIAVYYHHRSMYTAFLLGKERRSLDHFSGSPLNKYYLGRQNLIYLLEGLQYQYDFVATQQVEKGILGKYKVLFMPSVLSLSDKEVKEIAAFVKRGGIVIADLPPNTHDDLAMKRKTVGVKGAVVLGKIFDDKDPAQKKRIDSILTRGKVAPIVRTARKITGCETMHFVDGKNHLFTFLHDPFEAESIPAFQAELPVKGHIYDLRRGLYLGYGNKIDCRIPTNEGSIFGVYPYKAKALKAAVPSRIRRGGDLTADVALELSGGKAGKHIFHVEVIPPNGEARFFMKRNILVKEGGRFRFAFRLAHNDPVGKWKFLVRDVLTGMKTVKEFTLVK